jgi:hypothetical protein
LLCGKIGCAETHEQRYREGRYAAKKVAKPASPKRAHRRKACTEKPGPAFVSMAEFVESVGLDLDG